MSLAARRSLNRKLNYAVDFKVLSATNFGVPQKRERVYIVGFDRDYYGDLDAKRLFDQLETEPTSPSLAHALLPEGSNETARYTISDKLWDGLKRRMARHEAKGNGFGHKVFGRDDAFCNHIRFVAC